MSFNIVKLTDPIQFTNVAGGLVPRGAYDNATDYAVGDSVDYNGSSYVMHTDAVAGTLPTDTTKWQVLANKGNTGATGATGDPGTNGQGVPTGGTSGQILTKDSGTDFDTSWQDPTGAVDSVNGQTGVVILDADDIDDTSTTNKFVTSADITKLSNLSGTNTGDQDLSSYATTSALTTGLATKQDTITGLTASGSELNILDGATLTTTELNYVDGVTSAIQTQLNGKLNLTGGSLTGKLAVGTTAQAFPFEVSGDTTNTAFLVKNTATASTSNVVRFVSQAQTAVGDETLFSFQANFDNIGSGTQNTTVNFIGYRSGTAGNLFRLQGGLATFYGNAQPTTDSTYTLGTSSAYWSNTYTDRLYLNSTADFNGSVAGTANLTGSLGILATSGSATHSLTLGSTATGIALYNTSDQTTNYERVRQYWSGNIFYITGGVGGTGTNREMRIGTFAEASSNYLSLNNTGALGIVNAVGTSATASSIILRVSGSHSASSGIQYGHSIAHTISQSGTAGYTALLINPSHSATGSGAKLLTDWQVGGTSLVKIQSDGVFFPVQKATASPPTYVKGGLYFDTTLNKLMVGGATAWEQVTSV